MLDKRLLKYIDENLAKGYAKKQVAKKLLLAGWSKSEIGQGFSRTKTKTWLWLVIFMACVAILAVSVYFNYPRLKMLFVYYADFSLLKDLLASLGR